MNSKVFKAKMPFEDLNLISVELMGITVSNPGGTGRC
jgi:hypothetical protein